MTSIALLVNRDSGDGAAERVDEQLAACGADVESFPIGDWKPAARSGAERLVVAGGDGSIACAAAAAADAGIPLAVIPAGTANDFAARMDLPDEIEACARLAANGTETRRVDLARLGGRPFVNVASFGIAPAAAVAADGLKARLGPLAYAIGSARAATFAKPLRCRLECDGELMHDGKAWQISIASTGAFGGGSRIDADADDGRLDAVVINVSSRIRLIKHAYGLRTGSAEGQTGIDSRRCSSFDVTLQRVRHVNVDGEILDSDELAAPGEPIHAEVARKAFELVIG